MARFDHDLFVEQPLCRRLRFVGNPLSGREVREAGITDAWKAASCGRNRALEKTWRKAEVADGVWVQGIDFVGAP